MILEILSNNIAKEKRKSLYTIYFKTIKLIKYIIFGIIAIVCELLIRKVLILIELHEIQASLISLPISIILAFYCNVKFNFKIKKNKLLISALIFTFISSLSMFIQFQIKNKFLIYNNYEENRILMSGLCFIFFYFLHIKFSFKDEIQIGVAVYANGIDDINKIYDQIKNFPDFIHIDLVDKTFNPNAKEIDPNQIKLAKKLWRNKEIHMHIMSKKPDKWIEEYIDTVDKIFFHFESDIIIEDVYKKYKLKSKKLGLAVSCNTNVSNYSNILEKFKNILLLSIKNPGYSGQIFEIGSYEIIKKINNNNKKNNYTLCVDGGVNKINVNSLIADEIVSGSYVLKNQDPIYAIFNLKFS